MPRDWPERWDDARIATIAEGSTDAYTGRMVALKNHPIWQALGDGAGGYRDTLGNPWPPFAFRSGMGVIEVSRDDAMDLGLIDETTQIPPEDLGINDGFEVSAARFSEALQAQLAANPMMEIVDGVIRIKGAR
jgi:hypothetical protein